jgi:hypothetical protein
MAATAQTDIAAAWRTLVTPADRIGIKVAASGGRYLSSHPALIDALVDGLAQAGVSASQIVLWDRDANKLRQARFTQRKGGYSVRSIAAPGGYDKTADFAAPIVGRLIWGDLLFHERLARIGVLNPVAPDQLSSTSHLARLLSKDITKVINVPVLMDEAGCGVAGALYNMTVPNLDNWRRFLQPDGWDSIPEIYTDERIGPKVVLHIMDGLVAQFAGGPEAAPNYAIPHATLYASKDPVALDTLAARQIDAWRRVSKLPPIAPRTSWLKTATDLGAGNSSWERITLKKISVSSR